MVFYRNNVSSNDFLKSFMIDTHFKFVSSTYFSSTCYKLTFVIVITINHSYSTVTLFDGRPSHVLVCRYGVLLSSVKHDTRSCHGMKWTLLGIIYIQRRVGRAKQEPVNFNVKKHGFLFPHACARCSLISMSRYVSRWIFCFIVLFYIQHNSYIFPLLRMSHLHIYHLK